MTGNKKTRTGITLALAAGLIASLTAAAPAVAETKDEGAREAQRCWTHVHTNETYCGVGDEGLSAKLAESGIRVIESKPGDARAASVEVLGATEFAAMSTNYTYVRVWDLPYYGTGAGWSTGGPSSTPCAGTTRQYVIPGEMANKTSSYAAYLGCRARLYDNANYSGAQTDYTNYDPHLGSMDNRAESLRLID